MQLRGCRDPEVRKGLVSDNERGRAKKDKEEKFLKSFPISGNLVKKGKGRAIHRAGGRARVALAELKSNEKGIYEGNIKSRDDRGGVNNTSGVDGGTRPCASEE